MKSLALHLIVFLLFGILSTNHLKTTITEAAAATDVVAANTQQLQQQHINNATAKLGRSRGSRLYSDSTSTTTTPSPSLRRPLSQRRLATVPITAATTATVPTKKIAATQQQQQQQQQQLQQQQQQQHHQRRRQPTVKQTLSTSESSLSEASSASSASPAHANMPLAAGRRQRQRQQQPQSNAASLSRTSPSPSPPATATSSSSARMLRERTARDTLTHTAIASSLSNEFSMRQNSADDHNDNDNAAAKRQLQHNNNNNSNKDAVANDVHVVVGVDAGVGVANNYNQRQYKRLERRQPFIANDGVGRVEQHQTLSTPANQSEQQQQQQQLQRRNDNEDNKNYTKSSSPLPASLSSSSQPLKTPRMIQRLVAGHLQNAEGHSSYEVSAVTSNNSVSNSVPVTTTSTVSPSTMLWSSTTSTTSPSIASTPLFFRRRPATVLSSSYRHGKLEDAKTSSSTSTTAAPRPYENVVLDDDDHDDDEALLDDPADFDNWDNGILRLSAGSGKESALAKSKKNKEDSKKTLADQVRDGKYGLIEKELFRRDPKRPGILSYLPNKEVPLDNAHSLGGLNEEDIWLAEDHLLVIKGGSLNEGGPSAVEPWPPIDDYDAPSRQIKLPKHPKVPPPFPVQLDENGPIQFIGNNKFTVVYPVANESLPVYTAGPETNYTPSTGDSDNEKNLITRPGTPQDTTEDGPGYFYPAPYPPWIYHNQTFVNPFLKNARPITFPGLGPFPLGRNNGTLDNINATAIEELDEDDPSLYYPPAYSFIYKSNYTNAVPPGPLVPGIVLPPPPNQFTRLEKHEKSGATNIRQRPSSSSTASPIISTTTPSTTTSTSTTTTTTTTTQAPYRHNVITKISEYTPKIITITPSPPGPLLSTTKLPLSPPPTPPPSRASQSPVKSVPVPVAVPVPIYPINYNPTTRPNIVSFVPTTPESSKLDTLSKSNPIYYEYFEAKRQPGIKSNVIDDFLSTTVKPIPTPKPIKLYATSKRPFKSQQSPAQRNYLPQRQQYLPDSNIVYITPKPQPQVPIFKPRPLENFEREVNAIRETLRFYKNQQLRDNTIPRTPKSKPIYEYSFDATKNLQPAAVDTGNFQPPEEFDGEPFKPMVTYSPAVNDENGFKAIAYDKADNEVGTPQSPAQVNQAKYQTTTTLVPVQPEPQYRTLSGRPKKLRLGAAKYLQQPLLTGYEQQSGPAYGTTPRSVITTQLPWVSLEAKEQEQQQLQQQQQQQRSERLQMQQPILGNKQRNFNGYYYRQPLGPPPPPPPPPQSQVVPSRQNNRFYDEPFHNPVRKIVNYRPQQQPPPQQQQQQQWSLENDTYVNYAPNRPPLNPDAEFINPYHTLPVNIYGAQQQRLGPPPPPQQLPALSHQSQYYAPPQRFPIRQLQPQQAIPLHRDIQVNYRQPLPPINPDSEYISHPQVVRNQANQLYRAHAYRLAAPPSAIGPSGPQSSGTGDPSNLYYITPKYRRASGYASPNANNARANTNTNANDPTTSAERFESN